MRKIWAVLALLVLCASNAFAWGQEGHRIVCQIALGLLTPAEQQKVTALAKGYVQPPGTKLKINDFPDACIFPDEARGQVGDAEKNHIQNSPWMKFKPFDNQHFLNVDRTTKTISESDCHDDCVLTGIASQAKRLNSTNAQERAEGLIFLGHFVGDIHQPLHISYKDDKGGNDIKPVIGGFYPVPRKRFGETNQPQLNLHSVWDGSILRKQLCDQDPLDFADALRQKITPAQKTEWLAKSKTPLDWAQESYDVTRSAAAEYCHQKAASCDPFGPGRTLGPNYQTNVIGTVEQRLQQAGVRLAALIHDGLAP
ncbi:MAG TPA: S1/P1 nuclease [Thermoanaerobaculia bacterium]|jgi:hypothetical protein